jgi:hypothetical protein
MAGGDGISGTGTSMVPSPSVGEAGAGVGTTVAVSVSVVTVVVVVVVVVVSSVSPSPPQAVSNEATANPEASATKDDVVALREFMQRGLPAVTAAKPEEGVSRARPCRP